MLFEAHENQNEEHYFTLDQFKEKGISVFSDKFSKFYGYNGKYYEIKRVARHPNYVYQIIAKHHLA